MEPEDLLLAYNSLLLVPILKQMIPDYSLPYHFIKIYFNIILPSIPRSSE